MTASAILLSGNNFKKVDLFAKFLKLPILSASTFYKIQKTYLIPAIDNFWVDHQDAVLAEFIGVNTVILGESF